VSGASPIPDSANRVRLVNEDEGPGGLFEGAAVTGRGRFFLKNVPPGRYLLILNKGRRPGPGAAPSHILAAMPLTVANDDLADLSVPVPAAATVEGRVVFQGRGVVDPALVAKAILNLQSTVAGALTRHVIYVARPDASGRFEFSNVLPGSYRITVGLAAPAAWFADSVVVDGASGELGSIVIKPGQRVTDVVATLTDRRATLAGTILTESGEPATEHLILVYPVEERYWTAHAQRMHVARASQDGAYVIEGIRPGRYRVATLLDVDVGAWFEPSFLRQLESTSTDVSIAGDERQTLPLRVP